MGGNCLPSSQLLSIRSFLNPTPPSKTYCTYVHMYREKRGGEGQIADSLPVFHIQLLNVALASGHIFSPVPELLAKTPFLQIPHQASFPILRAP